MSQKIQAAFFDIDGTLLPFHADKLPDSTIAALESLRRNGIKIFIATGRPPIHLSHLPAIAAVPFDGFVTMNGQYCFLADGELLYSRAIDPASLRMLVPYIQQEKLSVGLIEKDTSYYNLINDLSAEFCHHFGFTVDKDVAKRIETAPVYQLSAFLPEEKQEAFLRHCPGCTAVRWNDAFVDVLPADGGKTVGIDHVLQALGLTREQSIAFGDGGNDVEMLRYAGIGVAMGNGCPEAKAAADYITDPILENGLANALRHFGLI